MVVPLKAGPRDYKAVAIKAASPDKEKEGEQAIKKTGKKKPHWAKSLNV